MKTLLIVLLMFIIGCGSTKKEEKLTYEQAMELQWKQLEEENKDMKAVLNRLKYDEGYHKWNKPPTLRKANE